MLDVLAAPWPGDTFVVPPPRTSFLDACDRDPGKLQVGVLTTPVIAEGVDVDPACLDAARLTAALLEELGHRVSEAPVPFPPERWASFEAIWSVLSLLAPVPPEREHQLVPLTRWLRAKGRQVSGIEYAQAMADVQSITRDTAAAWAPFDVILSPTLARLPARVGELRDDADPAGDLPPRRRTRHGRACGT